MIRHQSLKYIHNRLLTVCGMLTIAKVLVSGLLGQPACAEVYSLEQCVETAIANNIAMQQQGNEYTAARIQYKQSLANLSPDVSGSASQNWSFGRSTGADNVITPRNSSSTSFNLSASLMLFDGLGMKFAIDKARASMQQNEASLQAAELQLRLNITSMYLKVLLVKQMADVAQQQLDNTRQTLHKDSALIAAHRKAEGDIYAILSQEASEELTLVQRHNDLRMALLDLAQAMNIDADETFDIVDTPIESLQEQTPLPSRDEVWDVALANRPEIKAKQFGIESQRAALKQQKAAYSPTLSAHAGMGTSYYNIHGGTNSEFSTQLSENLQGNVGLTLSVPIYNRMQTPYAVKRQQLAVDNAQLALEEEKQTIRKEIDQAYYNALSAAIEAESAQKAVHSAEEALRYELTKYEAGRATSYEYTNAKTTYAKACSNLLQAQYTYIFRLKILKYYQGEN